MVGSPNQRHAVFSTLPDECFGRQVSGAVESRSGRDQHAVRTFQVT
jgi:hypothetical protein